MLNMFFCWNRNSHCKVAAAFVLFLCDFSLLQFFALTSFPTIPCWGPVPVDKGARLCGKFVRDGENVGYGAGLGAPGMEIERGTFWGMRKVTSNQAKSVWMKFTCQWSHKNAKSDEVFAVPLLMAVCSRKGDTGESVGKQDLQGL